MKKYKNIIGVGLVALIALITYANRGFLSLETLQSHYETALNAVQSHFLLAALSFFTLYTVAVALSFPGALILTLTGGLLFGTAVGGSIVLLAATTGATLIFLAARFFFKETFEKKVQGKLASFKQGFEKDAFNYLLFLRLTPLFPFWLVNLAPAFLNVTTRTYIIASFLGMLPATFIFASIGNGLGSITALKDGFKLTPDMLLALAGLGLLALLPILVKRFFKGANNV